MLINCGKGTDGKAIIANVVECSLTPAFDDQHECLTSKGGTMYRSLANLRASEVQKKTDMVPVEQAIGIVEE
jgi:hypothetical protein